MATPFNCVGVAISARKENGLNDFRQPESPFCHCEPDAVRRGNLITTSSGNAKMISGNLKDKVCFS
ncbi:MAG: hypothetical protein J6W29_05675 [Neisseriaceae bacterium]|nr:hypothetical protein [Neisseriaceae bacterium]